MKKRDLSPLRSPEMSGLEALGNRIAEQACLEGAVLLENNGALPLKPQKIALYGYGARHTIATGIGSGDIVFRYLVTIDKGLKNHGFTVTSTGWLDRFDIIHKEKRAREIAEGEIESQKTGIDLMHVIYAHDHILYPVPDITDEDIREADCDTAVYVLSRQEGEGIDNHYVKGEYLPFDEEIAQLEKLRENFRQVILILNTGSPIEMRGLLNTRPDAVLQVFQGGADLPDYRGGRIHQADDAVVLPERIFVPDATADGKDGGRRNPCDVILDAGPGGVVEQGRVHDHHVRVHGPELRFAGPRQVRQDAADLEFTQVVENLFKPPCDDGGRDDKKNLLTHGLPFFRPPAPGSRPR